MKHGKRGMCGAMAAILALGLLAGCGGQKEEQEGGGPAAGPGTPGTEEFVYVPKYIPIKGEVNSYISNATYANGALYATSWGVIGTELIEVPDWDDPWGVAVPLENGVAVTREEAEGEEDGETPAEPAMIEQEIYGQILYKIDLDGNATKIPYTPEKPELEEGKDGDVNADSISVAADGTIYILERTYISWNDAPEDVERYSEEYWKHQHNEQSYALAAVADDGTVLSRASLESLNSSSDNDGSVYLSGFAVDDEGNICISAERWVNDGYESKYENVILVLDGEGKELFSIPMERWVQNLFRMPDGSLAAAYYGDSGEEIAPIDLEAKALGEGQRVNGDLYDMSAGGGDYDFYFTSGVSFFGYDLESGERTKLLNWINCDVDPDNLGRAFVLDDGRVVAVSNDWSGDEYKGELVILEKVPAASVPQKQRITLATQYLSWNMRGGIINFNKSNDLYHIDVLDYSEYNTEEDYSAGLTKLKAEILSGSVPDILDLSELPVGQFAARGILEDLYPYIDADPELRREDLMENVLKAYETDGKLYQTITSFSVFTAIGAASAVGDRTGWTVDEFQAALRDFQADHDGATAFDKYTTRDSILQLCLYLDMDSFVDWSTGACSFDSPEFIKLLEFANSFPSEFDWENYEWTEGDDSWTRLMTGRQMLETTSVGNFNDLQMYDALFGGKSVCVGYPTSYGTGNMFSASGNTFAMSSKCSDKDAAWQFLRQFFTESYQAGNNYYYWGFPTNKNAFEKKLKEAMTPEYVKDENGNFVLDENGEKIEIGQGGMSVAGGSFSFSYHYLTEEEAAQLRALIASTTKAMNYDQNIYDIVQEQIAPYFDGQRSAADVAKLVQSKAILYVNESR